MGCYGNNMDILDEYMFYNVYIFVLDILYLV